MKDYEINEIIGRHLGWKRCDDPACTESPNCIFWWPPGADYSTLASAHLPDFVNDHNALRTAEASLDRKQYTTFLLNLGLTLQSETKFRADAILRTIQGDGRFEDIDPLTHNLRIQVDFFKPSGKWYTGGIVDMGIVRFHCNNYLSTLLDSQQLLSKSALAQHWIITTRDLPELITNPNYKLFSYGLFIINAPGSESEQDS